MDLTPLEVKPGEAAAKLDEYRQALRQGRSAEDEAIAAGYRAIARGLPVISLSRTIAAGGLLAGKFPKLAVVGATATECYARWDGTTVVYADTDDLRANRGALVGSRSVRVPLAADDLPALWSRPWGTARTVVPLIPPKLRPKPRRLRHCHILWEVEAWAPVAPRDPALLRHIRGDLWSVLAVWDLTELERTVLSQRAVFR